MSPPVSPVLGPILEPVDPVLPQLSIALNAPLMRPVWAAHLRGASQLLHLEIERIRYRPGRTLSVLYRLSVLSDRAQAQAQTVWVAARFCEPDAVRRRHDRALRRLADQTGGLPLGPTEANWPALSLDEPLGAIAHWWPHDPGLPVVRLLADPRALAPSLARALASAQAPTPAGCAPAATVSAPACRVQPVQYVPGQRVTARVTGPDAAGRMRTVYAKANADGSGPRTHAAMLALWHSPARRQGALRMAQPLLWDAPAGLHWCEAMPGEPDAPEGLRPAGERVERATQVGRLLGALHLSPVELPSEVQGQALRSRLAEVVGVLGQVRPELRLCLAALAARLRAGLWQLEAAPRVTLHGDLHPRNLLWHRGKPGLIDFDKLQRGPAWLDLGSWCADAAFRGLLASEGAADGDVLPSAAEVGADGQALVQGWCEATGLAAPTGAALAWSVAWHLLCERAWRCTVNLKPGRHALLPAVLSAAQAHMDRAENQSGAVGPVTKAHGLAPRPDGPERRGRTGPRGVLPRALRLQESWR